VARPPLRPAATTDGALRVVFFRPVDFRAVDLRVVDFLRPAVDFLRPVDFVVEDFRPVAFLRVADDLVLPVDLRVLEAPPELRCEVGSLVGIPLILLGNPAEAASGRVAAVPDPVSIASVVGVSVAMSASSGCKAGSIIMLSSAMTPLSMGFRALPWYDPLYSYKQRIFQRDIE
jgi:hypothetical protein